MRRARLGAHAPPLDLRAATAADVPEMHEVERECFADPWSPESFRAMIARGPVIATVARRDRALVGYCFAWQLGDEAEVTNIAVAPAARRAGVGAALLDHFLQLIAERGGATVYLEVRESNVAAQALYRRRGFVPTGRRKGYYRAPAEDAVVMRRERATTERPD